MARKKTPEYLKSQIKEYGNIIKTGTEVLKEKSDYKVISISPCIDIALGGGVREGCWVTLTGDPKRGKTTTAMQIATNCQKERRCRRRLSDHFLADRMKRSPVSRLSP